MYVVVGVSHDFVNAGAIFEAGSTAEQTAFKYGLASRNRGVAAEERRLELQALVNVVNTGDTFKLSRLSEYTFYSLFLSTQ